MPETFAQRLLEEISLFSFDEATVGGATISSESDLTASGDLGYESGETVPDDIDDYNGQTFTFATERLDSFSAAVSVHYADTGTPANNTTSNTYLKRVSITVTNADYLASPVTLEYVFAYY